MRGGAQSHESYNNANSSMSYQGGVKNNGMSGPDMQYQGPLRNDQKFSQTTPSKNSSNKNTSSSGVNNGQTTSLPQSIAAQIQQ